MVLSGNWGSFGEGWKSDCGVGLWVLLWPEVLLFGLANIYLVPEHTQVTAEDGKFKKQFPGFRQQNS